MQSAYINLQQSKEDSILNIQFLIDKFKRDSVDFPFQLNINQLELAQARVRYNDILVDQVDVNLALPTLTTDSLDIYLHSLHLRAQMDRLDASFEANIRGGPYHFPSQGSGCRGNFTGLTHGFQLMSIFDCDHTVSPKTRRIS